MRVCFLIPTDLWQQPAGTGAYARAMRQVELLRPRGDALHVVSWLRWADSPLAQQPEREVRDGIEVRRLVLPPPKGGLVPRALFFRRLTETAAAAARETGADAFIVHDPELLPAAVKAAKGRLLFYDSHEHYPAMAAQNNATEARLMDWVERRAARRIAHCYTVSEGIAARFRGLGVPTTVTYNAKPWARVEGWLAPRGEARASQGWREKDFVIAFLGSLSGEEGLDVLLDALAVAPREVRLVAYGGPPSAAGRYQGLVEERGLGDRARIRGPVPAAQLYAEFSGADAGALLLPDKGLNWQYRAPNKLFDYMALGLPVLTTPLEEPRRIVSEAGCGLVVERTPAAVAKALERLAAAPEERARLGAAGQRAFRDLYCGERMEERVRASHAFWR